MLLFVMVDALRHDYINPTDSPYLQALAAQGLSGSVVPSFGFEPDAAYLAGLQPDQADGGAMFWLDPAHSPFRFVRFLPGSLDALPAVPARLVRKAIRLIAQLLSKDARTRSWASPAWIPMARLPRFAFASTRLMDQPGFVPSPTVFDHLRASGCPWYFHGMPTHRVAADQVMARFTAEFTGREAYAFVHIGDLDAAGHHFGPCSNERRAALHHVDRTISLLVDHARAKADRVELLILGDHGMCQVERALDVTPIIRELRARGLAFDYFIDATLFRCWSQDEDVLRAVRGEFCRLPGLIEIGEAEALRYGLRYPHNRFWDVCWQAEAGLVLTPNFHNNQDRLLGMHGYLPEWRDNQSAFVLSTPRLPAGMRGAVLDGVDMRRFFATQLALLGLPPAPTSSTSLI